MEKRYEKQNVDAMVENIEKLVQEMIIDLKECQKQKDGADPAKMESKFWEVYGIVEDWRS